MLPAGLSLPVGQAMQSLARVAAVALYRPTAQSAHGCEMPATGITGYLPAPQAAQLSAAVAPAGPLLPVAQLRQSASASASSLAATASL